MRLFFLSILMSLFSIIAIGQNERSCESSKLMISSNDEPNPWTSLDLNNSNCQFQFAIVTDRTGGHRPGVFMDGVNKLNLLQPEFVMSVGDLIEGYTEDTVQLRKEWDEFEGFISHLNMPFFYIPGNHDITNPVMAKVWEQRFGRTYYHFLYKDVLFLCLNSEDQNRGAGRGTISTPQYQYIEETLNKYPDVRWTLLFMHQPLWNQRNPERWPDVEELLADRKHTVFVGHNHNYVKYERNNGKYFILATTGGGSRLRGPQLGEFDHVVWVTMTDEGPILANLLLEGIWDEDVVTETQKQWVSKMDASAMIQFEPIFQEENLFEQGTYRIKLSNNLEIPMEVSIKDRFSWDLSGRALKNDLSVAPNSVEFVDFVLHNKSNRQIDELRSLPVDIKVKYEVPNLGKSIELPYTYQIKPLRKKYLQEVNHSVKIDGVAEEWTSFPIKYHDAGLSDNKVVATIAADEKNLYFAAKITDNHLVLDTAMAVWKQDCFNWIINVDKPAKLLTTRNYQTIRLTPATDHFESTVYRPEQLPPSILYASKANAQGYDVEISVPIQFIEDQLGITMEQLRTNFFVDDKDHPDEDPVRLYYQPDWRSKESWVGSGLYSRKKS